ncbi:hypothetical protein SDC9_61783 [bioreactor metagenome]|uniref:Uncharacterized protein n=1 Tax=bioreactor metagenome TaxID=1076179 RepID=A0A644XGR0_9ZZZZ
MPPAGMVTGAPDFLISYLAVCIKGARGDFLRGRPVRSGPLIAQDQTLFHGVKTGETPAGQNIYALHRKVL